MPEGIVGQNGLGFGTGFDLTFQQEECDFGTIGDGMEYTKDGQNFHADSVPWKKFVVIPYTLR